MPPLEQERLAARYCMQMARFETPAGMRLDVAGSEARGLTDAPTERSPTGAPPAACGDDHPLSGSGDGAANRGMAADFRGRRFVAPVPEQAAARARSELVTSPISAAIRNQAMRRHRLAAEACAQP